ncbi:hypothetical protein EsH8_XIII_000042 [Colletotrichum jinshuiense]
MHNLIDHEPDCRHPSLTDFVAQTVNGLPPGKEAQLYIDFVREMPKVQKAHGIAEKNLAELNPEALRAAKSIKAITERAIKNGSSLKSLWEPNGPLRQAVNEHSPAKLTKTVAEKAVKLAEISIPLAGSPAEVEVPRRARQLSWAASPLSDEPEENKAERDVSLSPSPAPFLISDYEFEIAPLPDSPGIMCNGIDVANKTSQSVGLGDAEDIAPSPQPITVDDVVPADFAKNLAAKVVDRLSTESRLPDDVIRILIDALNAKRAQEAASLPTQPILVMDTF